MDQNFPGPASLGLRRHEIDVLTAQESGRCGASDRDQLEFAFQEGRVLVTFDPDFLMLHKSGLSHAGICWCPEQKHSIGQLIQALLLIHGVLDGESMKNHVEFL